MTENTNVEEYKIILIGDSTVGKTSIINRLSENSFSETHITTIGVDFCYKDVEVDGTPIRLQVWDTAGQERFRAIAKSFYRGAHGVIVVYAIDNLGSFQNVRNWIADIDNNVKSDEPGASPVVKYIVGNKADLADVRCVEEKRGMSEAETFNSKFMETSAKSSLNIDRLFNEIAKDIKKVAASPIQKSSGPDLDDTKSAKSGGCC